MVDMIEKEEQIKRGKRIKYIRENELKMKKTELAEQLKISGQFLGLVEKGEGNFVYKTLKLLRDISGHSIDYILYGLDDEVISATNKLLNDYTEEEIIESMNAIKSIMEFTKKIKKY